MAEDELFDGDMAMDSIESNAVEDMEKDNYSDPNAGTVVNFVKSHYSRASTYRETEERRWIQAYRNYRGLYGPDVQFTSTEKSRIFVKVTKTKVLAAYGQIVEVLFGNHKFPISVDPTTLPEGVAESVFFESNPDMQKAKDLKHLLYLFGTSIQILMQLIWMRLSM